MFFKPTLLPRPCYSVATTARHLAEALETIKNPRLIVGFVSPNIDFHTVASNIKNHFPGSTVLLVTSAGELSSACSQDSIYLPASNAWESIVLHIFTAQIIASVSVATVNLHCQDIKSGTIKLSYKERLARLRQELDKITPPADLNYKNGLALTYVDGLSSTESYLMEAVYDSGRFPFLFIGGSAGGKLDFKETWIYNDQQVINNHAVICFIRLTDKYCYSVFKSQNFIPTGDKFIIGESSPEKRTVHSVIDPKSGKSIDFINTLCSTLHCAETQLETALKNHTFAIKLEDEYFIRSVLQIDYLNRNVNFACDLSFGEELLLVKATPFNQSLADDYAYYARDKPAPVGGILTDCILRRINNEDQLSYASTLKNSNVSGFSSFGELLGIHINQTATAVFFYENKKFKNTFIDNFLINYANYKAYFLKRQINRVSIIGNMKNRIIIDLHQYQKFAEKLVEDMPLLSASSQQLFLQMEEMKNNTIQFSDSAKENTQNASHILEHIIQLESSIKNINSLLSLVNNIADQTKLLSLNASIESARAGVHGKGFSVVAGEIRRLANSTHENISTSSLTVNTILSEFSSLSKGADLLNTTIYGIIDYLTNTIDNLHALSGLSSDNQTKMDQLINNMHDISNILDSTKNLFTNIASSDTELRELLADKKY